MSLLCAAVSPTYTVDNASTYTPRSASETGSGLGIIPIPPPCERPIPPSGERNIVPFADWVHGASNLGFDAGAERGGSDGATKPELSWRHWAMFAAGNLTSIASIVSVISQLLGVCFVGGDYDDAQTSTSSTKNTVIFTLTFGLMVEIFFAVVLSSMYRSPLDIKSVHHIPLEALWSCGEYMMVFVLAPFSWALIYLLGGTASRYLSLDSTCEVQGGSGLALYLTISGMSMTLVGLGFLGISVVGLCSSLGWPARCTDGCCAGVRSTLRKYALSTGLFLDLYWQLQGVVWAYRTEGFGLVVSVGVGLWVLLGAVLTAIGSPAPEKQDIVTVELYV